MHNYLIGYSKSIIINFTNYRLHVLCLEVHIGLMPSYFANVFMKIEMYTITILD